MKAIKKGTLIHELLEARVPELMEKVAEISMEAAIKDLFANSTKEEIEALLKKANFDFWNKPRPNVRGPCNGIHFIWAKIWGLGLATEFPMWHICSDDMKWEWRELGYKFYLGPVYLFGSFRVTPKKPLDMS